MSGLAISAALGASLSWAAGALVAYGPARRLGMFEFTRVQLVGAATLLCLMVTATIGWSSVAARHWPSFVVAAITVVLGNLAMADCLRRGGPRRLQILSAMAAPMAALLGYLLLGERLSATKIAGVATVISGICLAVLYGRGERDLEPLDGSLAVVVGLGLLTAALQAIGLIALKPALTAGTEPMAASAIRTAGAAVLISVIGIWPTKAFAPASPPTGATIVGTIGAGICGYVVAVSLLLYALRATETGVASVLGSLAPVFMLPMLWITTRQCPPPKAWLGAALVVLGLAAVALG